MRLPQGPRNRPFRRAPAAQPEATGPEPVHLITIEMRAWCGASGPGNGRASSAWREVTCTQCLAKRTAWLLTLVWDMLQVLPASREALDLAVRAGRLGVTDEHGCPLAMACATGGDGDLYDEDDEGAAAQDDEDPWARGEHGPRARPFTEDGAL